MPRDANLNGVSNPVPNFAPQPSANAPGAYGGTPQRGRPSESHNRMPRDAGLNGVSNPAPNFVPQPSANAPYDYGSQGTAQRGRPSESHNRMPSDANLNAASNAASKFVPQSTSGAPYDYGSQGTAQRRRPSESDSRMPREAGFNAPSNPSSNLYTRSSQFTPDSAGRPVRIDDTCSHTVLISFPLFTSRAGRKSNARAQCLRGYPASNSLTRVLPMTRAIQRLLSLPAILRLAGRGHLRILLPEYTYRSRQPDIILRTLPHLA
jgi:hypothetical protein